MSNFIIFLSFKFGLYLKSKMSLSLIFTHCGPYKLFKVLQVLSSKHAASDEKSMTKHNIYIHIYKYIVIKWRCETWYTNLKCNISKQYSYNIVCLK